MEKKHILLPIALEELETLQRTWFKDELKKVFTGIPQKELEEFLTASELAKMLKCSVQNIYDHKNRGTLPYYRLGDKILFKLSEVILVLEKVEQTKSRSHKRAKSSGSNQSSS